MKRNLIVFHTLFFIILCCILPLKAQYSNFGFDNVSEFIKKQENIFLLATGKDTLNDIVDIELRALNNLGEVAGSYSLGGGLRRIFVLKTDPNTFKFNKYISAGDFPGASGFNFVTGLNNKGDIVYNHFLSNGTTSARVLIFNAFSGKYAISKLASREAEESTVWAINDNQQMATMSVKRGIPIIDQINSQINIPGTFVLPEKCNRGYLGTAGNATKATEVSFPMAYFYNLNSELRGINSRGDVCGSSFGAKSGDFFYRESPMVRWKGSVSSIIDNLEGKALDINNAQQVCGVYYTTPGGSQRGFFLSPSCRDIDLNKGWIDINPDRETLPSKMTDEGLVVGTYLGKGGSKAFIWVQNNDGNCDQFENENTHQPSGKFYDLTELVQPYYSEYKIKTFLTALNVNESDYVIGTALNQFGTKFAYRIKIPKCVFGIVKGDEEWFITEPYPFQKKLSVFGNIKDIKIEYDKSPADNTQITGAPQSDYTFKQLGLCTIKITYKCSPSRTNWESFSYKVNVNFAPIPRPFNANHSANKPRSKAINRNGVPVIPTKEEIEKGSCNSTGYGMLIIQQVRPFYDQLADEKGNPKRYLKSLPLGTDEIATDMIPYYIEKYNKNNPSKRITYQVLADPQRMYDYGFYKYLKQFSSVCIPDGQPADFYKSLADNMPKLSEYVARGGVLIFGGISDMGGERSANSSNLIEILKTFNALPLTQNIKEHNFPQYLSGDKFLDIDYQNGYSFNSTKSIFNNFVQHPITQGISDLDTVSTWSNQLNLQIDFLKKYKSDLISGKTESQIKEIAKTSLISNSVKYINLNGGNIKDAQAELFYRTSLVHTETSFSSDILINTTLKYEPILAATKLEFRSQAPESNNVDTLHTQSNIFTEYSFGEGKFIAAMNGMCWAALNDILFTGINEQTNESHTSFNKLLENTIKYVGDEYVYKRFITGYDRNIGVHDLKNKVCFTTNLGVPNTDLDWTYFRTYSASDPLHKISNPNNFFFDGRDEWGSMQVNAFYNGRRDTVFLDILKAGVYTIDQNGLRNRYRGETDISAKGYTGKKPLLVLLHGWQPDGVNNQASTISMTDSTYKTNPTNSLVKKWQEKGYEVIELDWVQYADNINLAFSDKVADFTEVLKQFFTIVKPIDLMMKAVPNFWSLENTIWSDEINNVNRIPWKKEVPGMIARANYTYSIDSVSYKGSIHKLFVEELNKLLQNYEGNEIQIMAHSAGSAVAFRMMNELEVSEKCIRKQINLCDMYFDGSTRGVAVLNEIKKLRKKDVQLVYYQTTVLKQFSDGLFIPVKIASQILSIKSALEKTQNLTKAKKDQKQDIYTTEFYLSSAVSYGKSIAETFAKAYDAVANFAANDEIYYQMAHVMLDLKYNLGESSGNAIIDEYKRLKDLHGYSWYHYLYNIGKPEPKIYDFESAVIVNIEGLTTANLLNNSTVNAKPYAGINPNMCKGMIQKYMPPAIENIALASVFRAGDQSIQASGKETKTCGDDIYIIHNSKYITIDKKEAQNLFENRWKGYKCSDSALMIRRITFNTNTKANDYIDDSLYSTSDSILYMPATQRVESFCTPKWFTKDRSDTKWLFLDPLFEKKYNKSEVTDRYHRWGDVKIGVGFDCFGEVFNGPDENACAIQNKKKEVFDAGLWFVSLRTEANGTIYTTQRRFKKGDDMNGFYDPTKKTVIYIQDANLGSTKEGYRDHFSPTINNQLELLPRYWREAGYNFAFFNWSQLSDEVTTLLAEEKIYNNNKMRWRRSDGRFEDNRFITEKGQKNKAVKDILFEEFKQMHEQGGKIQLVGHGLGAQLAALLAEKMYDDASKKQDLEQLTLLNPYFSFGKKPYLPNNDSTSGKIYAIVKKLNKIIPVETYTDCKFSAKRKVGKSNYRLPAYYANDMTDSLVDQTAYLRINPVLWQEQIKIPATINQHLKGDTIFPNLQNIHQALPIWYLQSMYMEGKDPEGTFIPDQIEKEQLFDKKGRPVDFGNAQLRDETIDGNSARTTDKQLKNEINDGYFLVQSGGSNTLSSEDDKQIKVCKCAIHLDDELVANGLVSAKNPELNDIPLVLDNALKDYAEDVNSFVIIRNPAKKSLSKFQDYITKVEETNSWRPKPYNLRMKSAAGLSDKCSGLLSIHPEFSQSRSAVHPDLESITLKPQIENRYKNYLFEDLLSKQLYVYPSNYFGDALWQSTYTDALIWNRIEHKWNIKDTDKECFNIKDRKGNQLIDNLYLIGLYKFIGVNNNGTLLALPTLVNQLNPLNDKSIIDINLKIKTALDIQGVADQIAPSDYFRTNYEKDSTLWLVQHTPHDQWSNRNKWDVPGLEMGPHTNLTVYTPNRSAFYVNQDDFESLEKFYVCLGIPFKENNGSKMALYPKEIYDSGEDKTKLLGGYVSHSKAIIDFGRPNKSQTDFVSDKKAGDYNTKLNWIQDKKEKYNWTGLSQNTNYKLPDELAPEEITGILKEHFQAFKTMAQATNTSIVVRNSNKDAVRWIREMYDGGKYLPKPETIKGKSVQGKLYADPAEYLNIGKDSDLNGLEDGGSEEIKEVPNYGSISYKKRKVLDQGCLNSTGLASFDPRTNRGRGLIYAQDPVNYDKLDADYFCELLTFMYDGAGEKKIDKSYYIFPIPFFANRFQLSFNRQTLTTKGIHFIISTDSSGFIDYADKSFYLTDQLGVPIALKLLDKNGNGIKGFISEFLPNTAKIQAYELGADGAHKGSAIWTIDLPEKDTNISTTSVGVYFIDRSGFPIWKSSDVEGNWVDRYYKLVKEKFGVEASNFSDMFIPFKDGNNVEKKLYRDYCYVLKNKDGFKYYSDYDLHGVHFTASGLPSTDVKELGADQETSLDLGNTLGKSWWPSSNDLSESARNLLSRFLAGVAPIPTDPINPQNDNGLFDLRLAYGSFDNAAVISQIRNFYTTNTGIASDPESKKYDMVQHGPHDQWIDRNNYAVSKVNGGPQSDITIFTPSGEIYLIKESAYTQEKFYECLGIPFQSIYPQVFYKKVSKHPRGSNFSSSPSGDNIDQSNCIYWSDNGKDGCDNKFTIPTQGYPQFNISCSGKLIIQFRENIKSTTISADPLLYNNWEQIFNYCEDETASGDICSSLKLVDIKTNVNEYINDKEFKLKITYKNQLGVEQEYANKTSISLFKVKYALQNEVIEEIKFNNKEANWSTDSKGYIIINNNSYKIGKFDILQVQHKVGIEEKKDRNDPIIINFYADNVLYDYQSKIYPYRFDQFGNRKSILNRLLMEFDLEITSDFAMSQHYLDSLNRMFKLVSNHLYDVTDGQAKLGRLKVLERTKFLGSVCDNANNDAKADIIIFASPSVHPKAHVSGLFQNPAKYRVSFPRIWTENDTDIKKSNKPLDFYKNLAVKNYFNSMTYKSPAYYSLSNDINFKTMTHELGHYIFGFLDEYVSFIEKNNQLEVEWDFSNSTIKLGLMDNQNIEEKQITNSTFTGIPGTEMSNKSLYDEIRKIEPDRLKNNQSNIRNSDCWTYLKNSFQIPTYIKDVVQLKMPEEKHKPENKLYYPGPFEDIGFKSFTYDPSKLPENDTYDLKLVIKKDNKGLAGINVTVLADEIPNPSLGYSIRQEINQGFTGLQGEIILLGIKDDYKITISCIDGVTSVLKPDAKEICEHLDGLFPEIFNINILGTLPSYKVMELDLTNLLANPRLEESSLRVEKESIVKISPNPFDNKFDVTIAKELGKKYELVLENYTGTVLQLHTLNGAQNTIIISGESLSSGFYLIKTLCDGELVHVDKLIKR